jgi:hypothetical protein
LDGEAASTTQEVQAYMHILSPTYAKIVTPGGASKRQSPGFLGYWQKPGVGTDDASGAGAGEGSQKEAAMSTQAQSVVSKEADVWVLRVQKPNGKVQEYRCTTEGQARQLALVLNASAVEQVHA